MAADFAEVFCRSIQNDQSLCMRCGTRNRLNCWEVAVSPCCERSRNSCERCPVFIAHLRTTACPSRVLIGLTDGRSLEGTVFLTRGERLSDMLNDPVRSFLTVRQPMWRAGSPDVTDHAPVLCLSLRMIAWVSPVEEEKAAARDQAA
jgi:Family of unknown function (DUF6812)